MGPEGYLVYIAAYALLELVAGASTTGLGERQGDQATKACRCQTIRSPARIPPALISHVAST